MSSLPEPFELLKQRIDSLETRVERLELGKEVAPEIHASAPSIEKSADEKTETGALSGIFGIIGRAMLGIAGAYLLRALASPETSPRRLIAGIAIAYAIAWLALAVRSARSKPLAGAVYAGTSAIILAPMLWELTLRFHTLQPITSAWVLGIFSVAAFWMTWKEDSPVLWVSSFATGAIALSLQIVTHNNLAYIGILMMVLLLCDIKSGLRHSLRARPIVALATDIAIWILLLVYANPDSAQQDYANLGTATLLTPAILLFLLESARVSVRSIWFKEKLTFLDTAQAIISFLLMWVTVNFFAHQAGLMALGVASTAMALGCYTALVVRFLQDKESRNFAIFALWSTGLLLAGLLTTLPLNIATVYLGVCAVVAIALGVRLKRLTFELQGAVYLTVAVIASRSLQFGAGMLMGELAPKASLKIWLISACAVLAYFAGRERQDEAWKSQILHLISAGWAAFCVAALLARGLLGITALFVVPLDFHVALVHTTAICAMAIVLAFIGARGRLEMKRIAYAALALAAIKLLAEDLRHGHMEFVAASFFVFAVTLIAVPQLARKRHMTPH